MSCFLSSYHYCTKQIYLCHLSLLTHVLFSVRLSLLYQANISVPSFITNSCLVFCQVITTEPSKYICAICHYELMSCFCQVISTAPIYLCQLSLLTHVMFSTAMTYYTQEISLLCNLKSWYCIYEPNAKTVPSNDFDGVFDPYILICGMIHVCPFVHLCVCDVWQQARHYSRRVQPDSFIHATVNCTIDFSHFVPLSVNLTLAEDQNEMKTGALRFLAEVS